MCVCVVFMCMNVFFHVRYRSHSSWSCDALVSCQHVLNESMENYYFPFLRLIWKRVGLQSNSLHLPSKPFRFKGFSNPVPFIMLCLCQLIFLSLRVYIKLVIPNECFKKGLHNKVQQCSISLKLWVCLWRCLRTKKIFI